MSTNAEGGINGESVPPTQRRSAEISRLLKLEERREAAVAEIAIWITMGIVEGRLQPGEDLNSVDLASRFKTSRTPVREALMVLESEGLVEIRARRRPRVAPFTVEQIHQIYTVRRQLLSLLGELVADRATAEDLSDLGARLDQMGAAVESGDVDSYFWDHVDFQSRLLEIAGNEVLSGIIDSLELRTLVLRHSAINDAERMRTSHRYHRRILEAFQTGDREMAAMLYSRSIDIALGELLATLGEAPGAQPDA